MSLRSTPGARSSGGGQFSQCSVSLLPAPQISTASLIPTPLASLCFGYRRQTRVISQEGIWTFSLEWVGNWPLPPRFPVFIPSLGQLQLVWGLAGLGRLQGGIKQGYPLHPGQPRVCVSHTSQSLLPGMAYASQMGPAGDREALGHSPGRTGKLLPRAGLNPGKMGVDGLGWGRGRGRTWLQMMGGPARAQL